MSMNQNSLPIRTITSAKLDRYMEDAKRKGEYFQSRIFIEGKPYLVDSFPAPTDVVTPNNYNGRNLAEKNGIEKKLIAVGLIGTGGLDPYNPKHHDHYEEMLIKGDSADIGMMKEMEAGIQKVPVIISFYGDCVDAHRRWAILRRINKKRAKKGLPPIPLIVARLPEWVTPKQFYKIEVENQVLPSYKKKHDHLNQLLMMDIGEKIYQLTEEEIKKEYRFSDKQYAQVKELLSLMGNFLHQAGIPGEFDQLLGKTEHFVEIQKTRRQLLDKNYDPFEEVEPIVSLFNEHMKGSVLHNKSISHRDHVRDTFKYAAQFPEVKARLENSLMNKENPTADNLFEDLSKASLLTQQIKQYKSAAEILSSVNDMLSLITVRIGKRADELKKDEFLVEYPKFKMKFEIIQNFLKTEGLL